MAKTSIVVTVYNESRAGWRERENVDGTKSWQYEDALSEKHNGNELRATIESVRASTTVDVPIVVVDDGSTDDCAAGLASEGVTMLRHEKRIGIGYSRREGVTAVPSDTDVILFLDAHMRLSTGCIEHCSALAVEHDAVVWPDTRGLRDRPRYNKLRRGQKQQIWTGHGAKPRTLARKDETFGLFRYDWIANKPPTLLSRTHALISPGYFIPNSLWEDMKISESTRGFGGNEPQIWVKCFFLDIPILHTCEAMVRHLFRAGTGHYEVTSQEVYRNMAILARTCFDDKTWRNHWFPKVFNNAMLDEDARRVLSGDAMMEEHFQFQTKKKRPDAEFFAGLCLEPIPAGVE